MCECDGVVNYLVLESAGSGGSSYNTWLTELQNYPNCNLAPVRSIEQLEFYQKIKPGDVDSTALLGVARADPKKYAVDCKKVNPDLTDENGDIGGGLAGQESLDACYDGWINTIDGSQVASDANIWVTPPKGFSSGYYVSLAGLDGEAAAMTAEFNGSAPSWVYAIVECCTGTSTCYNQQ